MTSFVSSAIEYASGDNVKEVDAGAMWLQMLMWTHSLPSPPVYIDVAGRVVRGSDSVDDVLVIGSQDSPPEIHCFQFHSNTGQRVAPQACGPPWRVSVPQLVIIIAVWSFCDCLLRIFDRFCIIVVNTCRSI